MRKILCVLLVATTSVFATGTASAPAVSGAAKPAPLNLSTGKPANNPTKNPKCDAARTQIKANHEKIIAAFKSENACQLGKLQLQNRKIIKDNIDCFPQMKAQMARGQF